MILIKNNIEEIDLIRVENQLAKWEMNPQITKNEIQFNMVKSMRKIFEEYKRLKNEIQEQIKWLENDIEKTKVSTKAEKEPCLKYDDFRKVRLRAFNTKSKEMIRRLKNILKED